LREEKGMSWTVESETDGQRVERCDHDGTTEAIAGGTISACSECGKTWPTRFDAGAPTVRIVSKLDDDLTRWRTAASVTRR
jgi:hypothetical protein